MHKAFIFYLLTFLLIQLQTSKKESCKLTRNLPPVFKGFEVPYEINETYTVIELDPSTGAKCLDGSNYKFYFSEGSGSGSDKFMFHWQGGAFCGIDGKEFLESCLDRSGMFLGSSLDWGENGTSITQHFPLGYFSNMKEHNPDFWNWNKVLVKYCDGSNHQGYVEDPVNVTGKDIWFRGFNNTMATFNYVRDKFGLFNASEVIISGGSAGAQATYIWAPFVQKYLPKEIKLMGIPDAGLFLDVYNPRAECRLFKYLNQNVAKHTQSQNLELFSDCKYKKNAVWKCMVPEYIMMNIDFPLFVINPQNDLEALKTQAGVPCVGENPNNCSTEDKKLIHSFRNKLLQVTSKVNQKKGIWGFWLRSCFEHVLSSSWAWYGQTKNVFNIRLMKSKSLRDSLSSWYNSIISLFKKGKKKANLKNYFSDVKEWFNNPTCQNDK